MHTVKDVKLLAGLSFGTLAMIQACLTQEAMAMHHSFDGDESDRVYIARLDKLEDAVSGLVNEQAAAMKDAVKSL